jgi:hypothetical protein
MTDEMLALANENKRKAGADKRGILEGRNRAFLPIRACPRGRRICGSLQESTADIFSLNPPVVARQSYLFRKSPSQNGGIKYAGLFLRLLHQPNLRPMINQDDRESSSFGKSAYRRSSLCRFKMCGRFSGPIFKTRVRLAVILLPRGWL